MKGELIDSDEWLDELKDEPVNGVFIFGEMGWEDITYVLDVCQPTPVKVGMLNTDELMIEDALEFDIVLHVGSTIKPVAPLLIVYTPKSQVTVIDGFVLKRSGGDGFDPLYQALLPWDGQSLDSSLADVPSARRKLINLLVRNSHGTVFQETAPVFSELDLLTFSRNILLGFGLPGVFVGLLVTGSLRLGLSGGLAMVVGVFLEARRQHLHSTRGGFHG